MQRNLGPLALRSPRFSVFQGVAMRHESSSEKMYRRLSNLRRFNYWSVRAQLSAW